MTPAWTQRREELVSDCIVSPDVFNLLVDRLRAFVVPYQQALETEAGQQNQQRSDNLRHRGARFICGSPYRTLARKLPLTE